MTDREVDAAHAGGTEAVAASACANCGARVTGPYCSECGQRVEHAVHSAWHFAQEVAEDLTHADSRLWRTLSALLFKPGYLTQQFLAGRRVSYLPPLRLYLVLSVIFFLLAAVISNTSSSGGIHIVAYSELPSAATTLSAKKVDIDLSPRTSKECEKLKYGGPWHAFVESALRASCRRAAEDNGRELQAQFMHNLPRAIFLTVPILALVMKPMYRRPRRYYVEHLLFLLHDHAFVFAVLGLLSIVAALLPVHTLVDLFDTVVICYVPCYYYLAMRRVYGQSPLRTLGKLAVLLLAYLIAAAVVLAATGVYAVLSQ